MNELRRAPFESSWGLNQDGPDLNKSHFFYVKITKIASIKNLPRCHTGKLDGLLSTSHFRLTDMPSMMGVPNPGERVITNDGVSEIRTKQLMSYGCQ